MKPLNIEMTPGEKRKVTLTLPGGHQMPVWLMQGTEAGKTLVLTAGVHGCEYVGIQAAKHLFNTLETATLRGRIVILPLINQSGFFSGSKQIMVEDGKNINRVFPGSATGTKSEQIAYWLEKEVYPVADFIIDLHGGDSNEEMTPLVFFPVDAEESVKACAKEAAMCMPVGYRIPSTSKNGLYSYGVQKGVPGLLLEIGGRGRWNAQEVAMCIDCVQGVMGYLEMGISTTQPIDQQESSYTIYEETEKDGFWYPYVTAGSRLQKGQVIGELKDLDDNILAVYHAKVDGVILYYTDTLGVQKGDPLVAYCQLG